MDLNKVNFVQFSNHFTEGLRYLLLTEDQLGIFILVFANALYDQQIWQQLKNDLALRFQQMTHKFNYAGYEQSAKDDKVVFKKIQELGFDQIKQVQFRSIEPWRLQYNPLRALRPPRVSDAVIKSIKAPFNPDNFHFGHSFLRKEILWQGILNHQYVSLFYNKFPFAPSHCLLVPQVSENHPQFLTARWHHYIFKLCQQLSVKIPYIGFGYNSYGAYSSVNHLHFQFFIEKSLPIEDLKWQHQQGEIIYPARCVVFNGAPSAWHFIQQCHEDNQPYNMLYRANKIYIIQRYMQGQELRPAWSNGFAWYEFMGCFTLFSEQSFQILSAQMINESLTMNL